MAFISTIKVKDTIYDFRAAALGSSDVGTNIKPVYIKEGIPTICDDVLGIDITGSAVSATQLTQNKSFSNTTPAALQFYISAGDATGSTSTNGAGWPNFASDYYTLKMHKPGEAYNFVEIVKTVGSNSYLGYRTVSESKSSDWVQLIDTSNATTLLKESFLSLSGGTITGNVIMKGSFTEDGARYLRFGSETAACYLGIDNQGFSMFRTGNAIRMDSTSISISTAPGSEILLDKQTGNIDINPVTTKTDNISKAGTVNLDGILITTNEVRVPNNKFIKGHVVSGEGYYDIIGLNSSMWTVLGDNRINTMLYGNNVYLKTTQTSVTSDFNLKTDIEPFNDNYDKFFDNLKPVTYKYKFGNSGRTHFGLIAQEVEQALLTVGLTNQDCAAVTTFDLPARETYKNEKGLEIDVPNSDVNYLLDQGITKESALRYGELIGLLIDQVQKLKKEVKELKANLSN